MRSTGYLVVAGRAMDMEQIYLVRRWNLIGNSFLSNLTISESFFGTDCLRIEVFSYFDPYYLKEMHYRSTILSGSAYWIYLDKDQDWLVYTF